MDFLIHKALDSMADCQPNGPAAQFLDKRLSYAELSRRSNQLAHVLIDQGVRRHDRVGIFMDKSIRTPVAMYGIMKTGASYVPLDPAAPAERIGLLTKDCGIRHIVTAQAKARQLKMLCGASTPVEALIGVDQGLVPNTRCIPLETIQEAPDERAPDVRIVESDLAYIIYTSGSTGTPKGIMHTHHSGLSFARWASAEYGLSQSDRLSNHAPLHFDLSIFDYFAGVVTGAATVIVPEEHTKLPASYTKLLEEQKVSVLFTVPFALIQMLLRGSLEQRDLSSLRWAIFGGEPFPPNYLRELANKLPHVKFDNMYGPAEVNGCTHFTVNDFDVESIPIGPIAHCAEGLVVDTNDSEVAQGNIGELLVRTPTMMRGYWKRDDLNERAFCVRENTIGEMETYYRTGDLVQELHDGVLRFVGRADRQIKVRGYRLELDEIELALCAIDGIEEAATFSLESIEGSQEVYAQVTLIADSSVTASGVLKELKGQLPWYAIPTELEVVAEFPRTRTGKIHRRELKLKHLARRRQVDESKNLLSVAEPQT